MTHKMRVTKSDLPLDLECWVEELSETQLAAYAKVADEHNLVKTALKSALTSNEGKELFTGQVFQAYCFKGKVLQEIKEATVPKKPPKPANDTTAGRGRKRQSNLVYMASSDEEPEDDIPLAKRIAMAAGRKGATSPGTATSKTQKKAAAVAAATSTPTGKASPQLGKNTRGGAAASSGASSMTTPTSAGKGKAEKNAAAATTPPNFRPSEVSSVGGLVIGGDNKDREWPKDIKDTNGKETKLAGKTFPSLVVLAKPWLKVKDMSVTRSKLDSKVKLVLMLTPNKFTEWLIQEGLLKAEQKCANHRTNELKLGVYSDASKFPYTGGYVWISECCPTRFVSVFHGSIFEGAQHPPSCILKLIYHWSCQTNIQNVVQWVKVDNVYIKGVYTWLRAICTLAVHQKCKKLGGPEKFVEVGVISLGTTSQDGQQRQVKVEVLGVLDFAEKTIRLRAVEPVGDSDRNYKKRFQTILEPLQRWVHKDSVICIDLTVDKMTLLQMGFKNIVQAAATDLSARHNNSAVMDYLRRIVPRMFQNTLSLLSRQMIQQFLDELVWREQFGTYALQAFNNITSHIAEQTRMNTSDTLTQRLYQVATNPFRDWSILPANCRETPVNTTPKRLKKPINDADYHPDRLHLIKSIIKKEKDFPVVIGPPKKTEPQSPVVKQKRAVDEHHPKKSSTSSASATSTTSSLKTPTSAKAAGSSSKLSTSSSSSSSTKTGTSAKKSTTVDPKHIKKEKEVEPTRGLEELYYGKRDGLDIYYEHFPYTKDGGVGNALAKLHCPICDTSDSYDSNDKFQTHLVSHLNIDGKQHQFQCLYCLEKFPSESVLAKHNQNAHPAETKLRSASSTFNCLICPQRFNGLAFLLTHLQKHHHNLELPYRCQACNYRSSSHRDIVRHFYDDHKQQNFLQCPYCLDIYRFSFKGRLNLNNIESYYMHLQQHVAKRKPELECQKCMLSFIDKGSLKQHLVNHHVSMSKSPQRVWPLLASSVLIPLPRIRGHPREQIAFTTQTKFGDFYTFIDGHICAECNGEIINEDHFTGLMKCNKCNYKTCCERSIFEHSVNCNGLDIVGECREMPLPHEEMHCICGFSTGSGNNMAMHLASCGHKSAYTSVEVAQENTVKRNMLDMLGLVRRDGDPGGAGDGDGVKVVYESLEDGGDVDMDGHGLHEDQGVVASADEDDIDGDGVMPGELQFTTLENVPPAELASEQMLAPPPPPPPAVQHQQSVIEHQGAQADQQQEMFTHIVEAAPAHLVEPQYHIAYGHPEVGVAHHGHALTSGDIDMPLIGELADPNTPATPQFLGEVHTPMFDAVAAAEQQHYQMLQHPQQQQPPQH